MKTRPSKEASERLAGNILKSLQQRPRTLAQLADELGFSQHAVRARLRRLLADGLVHFDEVPTKGNRGIGHIWNAGPATPDQIAQAAQRERDRIEAREEGPGSIPKQETVRTYLPVHHRDPLVAALFGPPV